MNLKDVLSEIDIAYIHQYRNVHTVTELEEFIKSCPDAAFDEIKSKLSIEAIYIITNMRFPDARILMYGNLRKYFSENCVDIILGKDYYNMGIDHYTCDRFTTEDIKYEYVHTKFGRKIFGIGLLISFAVNIILTVLLILK